LQQLAAERPVQLSQQVLDLDTGVIERVEAASDVSEQENTGDVISPQGWPKYSFIWCVACVVIGNYKEDIVMPASIFKKKRTYTYIHIFIERHNNEVARKVDELKTMNESELISFCRKTQDERAIVFNE
jgi:hypothetical protein